jgi:hypothetical protein
MKRMITLLAVITAIIAAAPASAGEADVAKGVLFVFLYDAKCAKLPPAVMRDAEFTFSTLPRATVEIAQAEVTAIYRLHPTAKWCALMKQAFEDAGPSPNQRRSNTGASQ